MNTQKPLLNVKEVAEYLGVSPSWVYNAFEEGYLSGIKLSHSAIRFRLSRLDEWLTQRETKGRKSRQNVLSLPMG